MTPGYKWWRNAAGPRFAAHAPFKVGKKWFPIKALKSCLKHCASPVLHPDHSHSVSTDGHCTPNQKYRFTPQKFAVGCVEWDRPQNLTSVKPKSPHPARWGALSEFLLEQIPVLIITNSVMTLGKEVI